MGDNKTSRKEVAEYCPHCEDEAIFQWNIEKDGYEAYCPYCGEKIMLCSECPDTNRGCDWNNETQKCHMCREQRMAAMSADLRLKAYERFKLWWMMAHGISLKEMMGRIDEIDGELRVVDPDSGIASGIDALDMLEEYGFGGGSIWPCYDEFLEQEYMMPDVMRQMLLPDEWELYVQLHNADDIVVRG